jgi:hypothetical protein
VPFQVFVSYASLDDVAPPGGNAGFVTTFVDQLRWDLNQRKPIPEIWRDNDGRIKPSDQFNDVIQKGIEASNVLLVVLSDNWMDSKYCRKELDLFESVQGAAEVKAHIIVAAKHDMDPNARDARLQGQTAYKFYDDSDPEKPEYFMRGRREQLSLAVEKIANDIRSRLLAHDPTEHRKGPAPKSSGKIYLSKPASDMTLAYAGLVEELQGHNYLVSPEPEESIPLDSTAAATRFIDESLEGADVSIHLLGEKPGLATDDVQATPIVKLQMMRAASHAANDGEFQRVIWAPKVLSETTDRDPLAVMADFDAMLPTDAIDGSELSKFREFVIQRLAERAGPRPIEIGEIEGPKVYIYYRREDEDYALSVAEALLARQIEPHFPIFDGADTEITDWHKRQLVECDAVVVCWADAGEVWVSQQTPEWKDWRKLGRDKNFVCRGVIAGPPSERKQSYFKKFNLKLLPANEIDILLNLTAREKPVPEDFENLVELLKPVKAGETPA